MNRFIILIFMLMLIMPVADADNKQLQEAIGKELKTKMKEFKRGKWELFGSDRTLEAALQQHYATLNALGDDGREYIGIVSRFKSKSIGHRMAVNNVCFVYAQRAASYLKSCMKSELTAEGSDVEAEFEHFYSSYEQHVEREFKGILQESFSIIRCIGRNDEYEMQSFFIVNEADATRLRVCAIQDALTESEAVQQHAQRISEFVKEGLAKE
ncbi:MAG: hypothetical protein K2H21_06115 [Muribaculaceae bacterium]|nr:hypothetical protein [Muribaculaceae bacterium]